MYYVHGGGDAELETGCCMADDDMTCSWLSVVIYKGAILYGPRKHHIKAGSVSRRLRWG